MATYSAGNRVDVAELEAAVHVAPQPDDGTANGDNGKGNRRLSNGSSVSSSSSVGDSASVSDKSGSGEGRLTSCRLRSRFLIVFRIRALLIRIRTRKWKASASIACTR